MGRIAKLHLLPPKKDSGLWILFQKKYKKENIEHPGDCRRFLCHVRAEYFRLLQYEDEELQRIFSSIIRGEPPEETEPRALKVFYALTHFDQASLNPYCRRIYLESALSQNDFDKLCQFTTDFINSKKETLENILKANTDEQKVATSHTKKSLHWAPSLVNFCELSDSETKQEQVLTTPKPTFFRSN